MVTLCPDIPRTQNLLETHFQMAMLSCDHQLMVLQPKHIQLGKKTCVVLIVQTLKLILKRAGSGFSDQTLDCFPSLLQIRLIMAIISPKEDKKRRERRRRTKLRKK